MNYPLYGEDATEALLPYPRLADEIAQVLREFATGSLRIAARTALPLAHGTLLCMPASDDRFSITKIVTVHPGNAGSGRPTISGEVIVANAEDGRRLGLLHGGAVTRRRTAALSLLAARRLLRDSSVQRSEPALLLVFGAGDQALGHCEALSEGLADQLGPLRVAIATRSPGRAAALVARLLARGVAAQVSADPVGDVRRASVIVTATTSESPIVTVGPSSGAVICAVGAFRHDMAELAPEVVGGAARVVVDTLEGAKAEAGDLIQAVATGAWRWEAAEPLVAVLSAAANSGRDAGGGGDSAGGYSIFKSVGHAMYDLAAARVAFASSLERER